MIMLSSQLKVPKWQLISGDKMKRIRFLIMEQLPVDGRHIDIKELEQNVFTDAQDLNLSYSKPVFDKILTDLVDDQYVVNLGGRIIATRFGLINSNIFC